MPNTARHEKLRNLLRDKIVSGKYQVGDRFFSQNELMQKYGLSFSTVTRAMDELVRQGYLTRQQGKGSFIKSVQVVQQDETSRKRNVCLFAPWASSQGTQSSVTALYRRLEELRPDQISLRFVPHGSNADDLEPFLFTREPMDAAVFLYPLAPHNDFINSLSVTVPTLTLTYGELPEKAAGITTSYSAAVELATEHLLRLGHDQIAVVDSKSSEATLAMLGGYRKALRKHGVAYRESLVSIGRSDLKNYLDLAGIYDSNSDTRITAVLALDGLAAVEALYELRSMGLQVPSDVSMICFDHFGELSARLDSISTVTFSTDTVASKILQLLNELAAGDYYLQAAVEPIFKEHYSTAVAAGSHP